MPTLALMSGCRSENAPSGIIALADGSQLSIDDDGNWSLDVDGQTVFAMHGRIRLRSYDLAVKGPTALYTFTETSATSSDLDVYRGAANSGTGMLLDYENSDGSQSARVLIEPWKGDTGMPGAPPPATRITVTLTAGSTNSIAVPVRCDADATFLGFGAQYNAVDQRGEAFTLFVSEQGIGRDPNLEDNPNLPLVGDEHTTYFPMAWWLDARGHGVLFRTDQRVTVDLCASEQEVAWVEVKDDAPVEILVLHGPTPKDVITQLGQIVGHAASPPDWAFRPWIAAQGGTALVQEEVAALEAANVPFSAMWVQDWTGIRMNLDGGFGVKYRWLPDEMLYPDLAALTAELHAKDIKFLGYANPFVPNNLDHYPEMDAQGMLIQLDGATNVHLMPSGLGGQPDLSDPAARDYIKGFLTDMVEVYGMDGWMVDFGEWAPLDGEYDDGRDPVAAHNRYPIDWQTLNREVLEAARPDGDWAMFSRSGFLGVQGVSMIHWVGDQETNWSVYDGLPTVVPAMINLGVSGQSIVTHDIAGFSGGPSSKELYLRWTELGAFTPVMRTHQGADKLNNWSWNGDDETITHFRRFAAIHDALLPQLLEWRDQAVTDSIPMVRHLVLEFPEDTQVFSISNQYMLGDAFLVAPVVEPGATEQMVYLPAGAQWFHVWSGDSYEGGQWIEIPAPIGSPPVFSRDVDRADLRMIQ